MMRHPAFIPLSRDHHRTLLIAQAIKKGTLAFRGMAESPEGKRKEVLNHFQKHLKNHFKKEEKIFSECLQVSSQIDQLIAELIKEHRLIERLMIDLEKGKDILNTLDTLGVLLDKHIRKEERQLFELLQTFLSEEKLTQIASGLLE